MGIRLNWHKRYITLGPIATVLGLAFKLHDPDHLIGDRDEIGITLALVPTHLPGISIGRRHLPAMHVFQNGPNWGRDVFIPMDNVIGGVEQAGKGWKMLMSALAAGRGISLPSLSAAGAAYTAHVTGAYARIREQFHVAIAKFEAIQERLGRMAATAYLLDAARRMTCAALDDGHHPAVVTAIMKAQATERMRVSVNDAMDVHGGKAIIEGPLNYLGSLYRGVPIGITVEGANIVTRSLIQFGQGAIRCHPYLLKEMMALEDTDRARGLDAFDQAFWGHVGHSFANAARAFGRAWTGGLFAPAPDAGAATKFYRQLSRHAAAFALAVDLALLTLGRRIEAQGNAVGALRRHSVGALSVERGAQALERRRPTEGRFPAARMVHAVKLRDHRDAVRRDLRQFPDPAGRPGCCASSSCRSAGAAAARPIASPKAAPPSSPIQRAARDRLTVDLFHPPETEREHGLALLERAFAMTVAVQPIRDRMHAARVRDIDQALKQRTIIAAEAAQLKAAADAVAAAIAVDDFAPEELTSRGAAQQGRRVIASDIATDTAAAAASGRVERRPVYIIDGSRTPFIKARGRPGPFTPVDLAVQCGRPLLLRQPFPPDAFDQVILGCVNVIADEMNPARVAALRLGMGEAMTAFTVQINCGSGMQSIDTAYRYIREGVCGSHSGGRRRIAQPCAAGVQPQRGQLVRAAVRRARYRRQACGVARLSARRSSSR